MKSLNPLMLAAAVCCWTSAALAQLGSVTNAEPQRIFFGEAKRISVTFHNPGSQDFAGEVRMRLWQTTSATAVQLNETPWKYLRVLPGQTVAESAQLDFPAVKAETKFLVQWLENTNHIIGRTEVLVYPTNLLSELKPLAADDSLGVFDPQNQLKPLLKNLKIDFVNLENSGIENFSGKLAILGPFQAKTQMREGLANQVQALAKKDVAIVWLQPPPGKRDKLSPSFYSVPVGTNAVVVVQSELISDLANNPQSQLHLIYFCHLAQNPQPPILSDLIHRP
jgi:hypothetical protein